MGADEQRPERPEGHSEEHAGDASSRREAPERGTEIDRLLEDIAGQAAHEQREEIRAVSEDLARAERAQVTLADRLRAATGRSLTLHLRTGDRISGSVEEVAESWVLLTSGPSRGRELVRLASVVMVEGLGVRARPAADQQRRREQTLVAVLRQIARDRALVRVRVEGAQVTGRIAAVGADALDVLGAPTGEASAVSSGARVTLAISALLSVSLR